MKNEGEKPLNEISIMKALNNNMISMKGVPNIIDWGQISTQTAKHLKLIPGSIFIVMEKLGSNLKDVLFKNGLKIPVNDAIKIGI